MDNALISRDQCPRCKHNGRDNSRDNLAIYGDGHEYCYACGYYKPPIIKKRLEKLIESGLPTITSNKPPDTVILPFDATVNLPDEISSRLSSWNFTNKDIKDNKFMWSESRKKLIMPVYDGYGQLLMYQERTWDLGLPKYLTFGKASDTMHIIRPEGTKDDNSCIILCEDLISAIRISKYKPAMPLWGSDIPLKTIRRLATQFYVVGVWLDPDMKLKAVKDVIRISQYVPAFFIESGLDPKFYNNDRIKEHIDISGYHMLYQDHEAKSWSPDPCEGKSEVKNFT